MDGYKYSKQSMEKLGECHPLLQLLFNRVIDKYDITIVCGYRDEDTQNKYYKHGSSQLTYPFSKHNKKPSLAVDFAVYHKIGGVSYNEKDMMLVAGYIEGLADVMGISITLGARWSHSYPSENNFLDIGHVQLDTI